MWFHAAKDTKNWEKKRLKLINKIAMARILEKAGKTVSVSGFTDRIGKPIKVEVVTVQLWCMIVKERESLIYWY